LRAWGFFFFAFQPSKGGEGNSGKPSHHPIEREESAQVRPAYRGGTGRLKDDGSPNFAAASARCARLRPRQNRHPHRRWRGRFAVLDPARSAPGDTLVFRKDQEAVMTIEQHIEELRAELKASTDDIEIVQIRAELEAALNERERQEMQLGAPL